MANSLSAETTVKIDPAVSLRIHFLFILSVSWICFYSLRGFDGWWWWQNKYCVNCSQWKRCCFLTLLCCLCFWRKSCSSQSRRNPDLPYETWTWRKWPEATRWEHKLNFTLNRLPSLSPFFYTSFFLFLLFLPTPTPAFMTYIHLLSLCWLSRPQHAATTV